MKTILTIFLLLFVSVAVFAQKVNYADLPVTTESPRALQLYNEGVEALEMVQMKEAEENFTKAIELDPNFMMPHVMLALRALYNRNAGEFKMHSDKAINVTATLTDSEKLIQQAMKKLADDPRADVTLYAKDVVDQNPNSIMAHEFLANFQQIAGDIKGAISTYEKILSLNDKAEPVYNSLGYLYMADNQMDKAKDAFEKYMKAFPDNANVYDSMGDYYAKMQEYKKAHDSYAKAYDMDSTNFSISHEKAEKIKPQMAETK